MKTDMPLDLVKKENERSGSQGAARSRRTLYRDLIVSIILVVTGVFAVVLSLTYGYLSYKTQMQSAAALTDFSDYLRDSLELPLWNFDEAGIKKICNSFFENSLVERLKVTNPDGSIVFERSRRKTTHVMDRQTPILHKNKLMGRLEIALNPGVFRQQQHRLIWLGLITLAGVIGILVVTLRIILKVFLISPLNELIQRTEQISRGEYDFTDFQAPQREIRVIVARFNRMADRIRNRERSLKKMNRRLEKEIFEHRDSESALLNSQQEMDSILRSTPDVIYRLDTVGRFTFVSDAVRRYGVTPEGLIGRPILDFIREDDHETARYRLNERRTGERSTKGLTIHAFGRYCRPDNDDRRLAEEDPVFLVDAEGLYVCGDSGVKVFVGTQGIARDITAQRKMESERRES
jgi:PAS domain-containing protein